MAHLFNKDLAKDEILQHIGSVNQIAGAKVYKYLEGKADGVKAVGVKTGSGFNFTVLADRCMDIAEVEYCGKPLAWISKNNIVAPAYYECKGEGWCRSFTGGMITTCGLTHTGLECTDEGEEFGLNGRVANLPAERFSVDELWEGDDFLIKIKGRVRQSNVLGENLVLTREISCRMGESKLTVNDVIENEGFDKTPFMFMYHINFGYPVVSEHSKLFSTPAGVEPWIGNAKFGNGLYDHFQKPTQGYEFENFLHYVPVETERAYFGIINEEMEFGGYIAYSPKQLPAFNQWKMMGQQDYAVGLEPASAIPEGRADAKKKGTLRYLDPGEKFETSLEIGVLKDKDDIIDFKEKCNSA